MSLTLHVDGVPQPKGSLVAVARGVLIEAGDRGKKGLWYDHVAAAGRAAMDADGQIAPFEGALRVHIEFSMPYPRTTLRKFQMGWWPMMKKPDVDKLARGVLDSLTRIIWKDDAQVCFLMVSKFYAWDDKPGALIIIDELSDRTLRELADVRLRTLRIMEMVRSGDYESDAT